MTDQRRTLGYPFAPIPERVTQAAWRGSLDRWDYLILGTMYERANYTRLERREPTPMMKLRQLAELIRWPHSHDALSKRLRHLRGEGWLIYTVVDARGTYLFTLLPDAPTASRNRSDLGLTSFPKDQAASDEHGSDARPTSTSPALTSAQPANRITKPETTTTPESPLLPLSDSSETPLIEGSLETYTRARDEGTTLDEVLLEELAALVDEGIIEPLDAMTGAHEVAA